MTDKNNKKEGFVLPDGYFNDLEQSVLSKMDNINNNGFKMPEVYFDDMQEQVIQKLKPLSVVKRKPRYRVMMAAASIASLIVASFWLWNTNTNSHNGAQQYVDIQEVEEEVYVDFLSADITVEQLAALIETEDLEYLINDSEEDYPLDYLEEVDLLDLEDLL